MFIFSNQNSAQKLDYIIRTRVVFLISVAETICYINLVRKYSKQFKTNPKKFKREKNENNQTKREHLGA